MVCFSTFKLLEQFVEIGTPHSNLQNVYLNLFDGHRLEPLGNMSFLNQMDHEPKKKGLKTHWIWTGE